MSVAGEAEATVTLSPLGHALQYAEDGLPVFPCKPKGKEPLTEHGFHDATTDPEQIRFWWSSNPDANIGLALPEGYVVVDVDDLDKARSWLLAMGFDLPATFVVSTGRGEHHYYRTDKHLKGSKICEGLDLKVGGKGYVIGAGSVHESGAVYEVKAGSFDSISPAPEWLEQLAESRGSHAPGMTPDFEEKIPEGYRDDTLISVAGGLRDRGFSQEEIEHSLQKSNELRCDPPLEEEQVRKIAQSVSRYPPKSDCFSPYRNGVGPNQIPWETSKKGDHESENGQGPDQSNIVSAQPPIYIGLKQIKARFRTAKEVSNETSEEVEWLVQDLLVKGGITELDGKVKSSGKTTLVLNMSKAIVDGAKFLGRPTTKTSVVYVSEQSAPTLSPALRRAGLSDHEGLHIILWNEVTGTSWPIVIAAAVEKCKEVGADVLIVDTFSQFAGLQGDSENSSGAALQAMKPLQLAAAENLAILMTRHDRKGGGDIGDSARGSSAISGAVDIILVLRRADGRTRNTVRILRGISRFEGMPESLVIELTEDGYVSRGSKAEVAEQEARVVLLDVLPNCEAEAMSTQEVFDEVKELEVKRTTAQRVLKKLYADEKVISRAGKGKRGDPYKYWQEIDSTQGDGDWAEIEQDELMASEGIPT